MDTGLVSKGPEVALCFWVLKVLASTVGITLAEDLDPSRHIGYPGGTTLRPW